MNVSRCRAGLRAALVLVLLAAAAGQAAMVAEAAAVAEVRVIVVRGTIDRVVARYVGRAIDDAVDRGARAVVVELDTPGGELGPALAIRDRLLECPLPTACYVRGRAWSAGALIGLACRDIIMAPGSSIGAAEPRPADAKTVSAVRAEFEATASATGRDPLLAAAMVDAAVEVPGVVGKGEILTLPCDRAIELRLARASASSRDAALTALGLNGLVVRETLMSGAEAAARVIVGPVVATVLLAVGVACLLAELFVPGFGIAGAAGLACLALYFGGHLIAGLAGAWVAGLFALGLALLVVEAVVPGFGVFGVAGALSLVMSLVLAAGDWRRALLSLALAIVVGVGTTLLLARFFGLRPLWSRLTLGATLSRREGFSAVPAREALAGRAGVALTTLRPAGVAEIDGARVDVVTEGEFLAPGTAIEVLRVEGGRVVVRARQGQPPKES